MLEKIDVLDYGFVGLEEIMGDDRTPAKVARTSFNQAGAEKTPEEDYGLGDYLIRHKHTTPLEMVVLRFYIKCPLFVARQWVRHRTASCITGDTIISFDLPGGKTSGSKYRHYPMTMKEIWRKWQPTVNQRLDQQTNALYPRQQVQKMCLRTLNTETSEIEHTTIKNVINNGVKQIVRVELENGKSIRATPDHLVYTNKGWLALEKAYNEKALFAVASKTKAEYPSVTDFSLEEFKTEVWKDISGYEELYEVSNLGRVRSWVHTRKEAGKRKTPVIKKVTISSQTGYGVVSLSKDGVSLAKQVHLLVLDAFVGPRPDGMQARHLNSVRGDARLSNLQWGVLAENNKDRMEANGHQRLSWKYIRAVSIQQDGEEEEVFDIEVESANHNFFANGVVVHNCNEVSGRYQILKDEFYTPAVSRLNKKAKNNKQGSSEESVEFAGNVLANLHDNNESSYSVYESLLDAELAPELARMVLPLNTYTEFYWQMNLHNLFHFLKLRLDPHAQYEIRVYAEAIAGILQKHVPHLWASFENHELKAIKFSKDELELLAQCIDFQLLADESPSLGKSRWAEFNKKINDLQNLR